jgi:hypothetical protein
MVAGSQRELFVFPDFRCLTAVYIHSQVFTVSLDFHFAVIGWRVITRIAIRIVALIRVKRLDDDYPSSYDLPRRRSRRSAEKKSADKQNCQT